MLLESFTGHHRRLPGVKSFHRHSYLVIHDCFVGRAQNAATISLSYVGVTLTDGERNQEGGIVGRRWSSGGGHHLPFPQSEYDTCNRQQSEQSKLQNLAGQHTDVLENLTPTVRKQVEVLRDIQNWTHN
ncbi:hypothetical protein L1987_03777 [Smallanthus sonchifolius]|uniref:Uncharacterized protein n=1 Tax=Smallanthus sonchifolius TaxID=185202 RepID=A0ACB9KBI9_9ASTR|nr:hypothetical protein L1987_03777 [Smallanthus sonchifolius]